MSKKNIKIENADSHVDKIYQIFYKSNIIQPLKSFCVIVEEDCSINKASGVLLLTPTTLSKQIKSLEEKLNIKLFKSTESRKDGKYIELTEDGEEFYKKAKPQIEAIDNLLGEYIAEKRDKENNTLRIITNWLVFTKIAPFINIFKTNHKNVDIVINFEEQNIGKQTIENNVNDIFITSKENSEEITPKLKFVELTEYIPYWVLYKGHPLENKKAEEITKNEILKSNFIFDKDSITMNSLKFFFQENNIKSSIKIKNFEGVEMEKSLIKNKMGIWLIFDIFLKKEDKNELVFKNAENMFPKGKYGFFVNSKNRKEILKEFEKLLIENKDKIFDKSFLE